LGLQVNKENKDELALLPCVVLDREWVSKLYSRTGFSHKHFCQEGVLCDFHTNCITYQSYRVLKDTPFEVFFARVSHLYRRVRYEDAEFWFTSLTDLGDVYFIMPPDSEEMILASLFRYSHPALPFTGHWLTGMEGERAVHRHWGCRRGVRLQTPITCVDVTTRDALDVTHLRYVEGARSLVCGYYEEGLGDPDPCGFIRFRVCDIPYVLVGWTPLVRMLDCSCGGPVHGVDDDRLTPLYCRVSAIVFGSFFAHDKNSFSYGVPPEFSEGMRNMVFEASNLIMDLCDLVIEFCFPLNFTCTDLSFSGDSDMLCSPFRNPVVSAVRDYFL
jgi:hypothetical protein